MQSRNSQPAVSDALWSRLVELRQRVMSQMQDGLSAIGELDLSLPQSTMVFQIAEREPLTVSALQAIIQRSQSATSHLVTQLELKGLVERRSDTEDGRRSVIHLTRQGRKLVQKVEQLRRQAFERVLGRVPPEVLQRLDAALKETLDALEAPP